MYKLFLAKAQDEQFTPMLVIDGPKGEQRIPLCTAELYQLLGRMDVFETGEPDVIEDFPEEDPNTGEVSSGTLTSWPIVTTPTPDAIRQKRLEPVEEAIALMADEARAAGLKKPTIGTLETPADGENLSAISEDVLSAVRERVEAALSCATM